MLQINSKPGQDELRAARNESRGLFVITLLFSSFVNLLMLAGPLYMLQLYDRVLSSRSEATLLALTLLLAFLYAMMAILDYTRTQLMTRAATRFETRMEKRVFEASMRRSALQPDANSAGGLRDLDTVQRTISSPVLMAFMDMPWTPIFLVGIALFHPWLGMLAVVGGAILVVVAIINQILTKRAVGEAGAASSKASAMASQIQGDAEQVQSMGMMNTSFERWQKARLAAMRSSVEYTDRGGVFSAFTKSFRLFLQSAMLGLGAYLVLQDQLSPGAMIAASILLGRALAPVELAIGQWLLVQQARQSWANLAQLLSMVPPEERRTQLPKPKARLDVQQITVAPPGEKQASLRMLSFSVQPGQAVGVIGPSGSGKSTLARAVTGIWRPAAGKIRLDDAALDQYGPVALGEHISYLPQKVQLFEGTVAENIARLSMQPDSEKVVQAAQRAGAHEMILALPEGYDTLVSPSGGGLSGGQIQRIGLARAMYGDPVFLVLDEPNANLDHEGTIALNKAIRTLKAEGRSLLIMAHRPAAIQECDLLLMLEKGARAAFGPRDQVLQAVTRNQASVQAVPSTGGA